MDDALAPARFMPKERDLVRREFSERFGGYRSLTEGFLVRRWATGPNKGQAKLSATIKSMLDRGLVSFTDDGKHWLSVHFTDVGWQALRQMAEDKRALPTADYQHILNELAASDRGR